jgi:hypothetical protein
MGNEIRLRQWRCKVGLLLLTSTIRVVLELALGIMLGWVTMGVMIKKKIIKQIVIHAKYHCLPNSKLVVCPSATQRLANAN